jgi:hypothetical protein
MQVILDETLDCCLYSLQRDLLKLARAGIGRFGGWWLANKNC